MTVTWEQIAAVRAAKPVQAFDVTEEGAWELVHALWWGTDSSLSAGVVDDLCSDIWAHQDGYGEPGYTPPQGHDWSGIRDSSDDAKALIMRRVLQHLRALRTFQVTCKL